MSRNAPVPTVEFLAPDVTPPTSRGGRRGLHLADDIKAISEQLEKYSPQWGRVAELSTNPGRFYTALRKLGFEVKVQRMGISEDVKIQKGPRAGSPADTFNVWARKPAAKSESNGDPS